MSKEEELSAELKKLQSKYEDLQEEYWFYVSEDHWGYRDPDIIDSFIKILKVYKRGDKDYLDELLKDAHYKYGNKYCRSYL